MSRRRIAICVGLNYERTAAQLAGCHNDATDWAAALEARGYTSVVLLEPTKAEYLTVLREVVASLRWGDRVVHTYSGHGTWLPDRDGDEPDRRDEALVLADYLDGGLVLDDELFQVFGRRRVGVRALILSDSCHSGTVSRFKYLRYNSESDKPAKARFLPPAAFLDGAELARAVAADKAELVLAEPRKGTVLISGCGDLEYSYDAWFGNRANGAFTYHAVRALDGATNIADWYQRIRQQLPDGDYNQTPQLTIDAWQRRWKV